MDRAPAVAGRFYPADPFELRTEVTRLIGPDPRNEPAIGVISPHAGYVYSGAIAGAVFHEVRVPEVAVVLCPNHTGMGSRGAIMSHGHWRIPGKQVPVDTALAEDLRAAAILTEDDRAHAREHALEVQLPFLVHRNAEVSIVPVCLGMQPYEACVRIGHALADVITRRGREEVLLVASTDMSHYLPAQVAREKDTLALERVERLDPEGLYRTVVENDITMCGFIPTTITLVAARALGATRVSLLHYASSGDASGDYRRVVGYAGLVIR